MRWWAWLGWLVLVAGGGTACGLLVGTAGVTGVAAAIASIGVAFMVTTPATFALMLLLLVPRGSHGRRPRGRWMIATVGGLMLLGAVVAAVAVAPASAASAAGIVAVGVGSGTAALGLGALERRARPRQRDADDEHPLRLMGIGGVIASTATLSAFAIWGGGLAWSQVPMAFAAGAMISLIIGFPAQLRALRRVTAAVAGDPALQRVPRLVLRRMDIAEEHLVAARQWARSQRAYQPLLVAQTALMTLALFGLNVQSSSPFALVGTVAMPVLLIATIAIVARQRRRLDAFLRSSTELST